MPAHILYECKTYYMERKRERLSIAYKPFLIFILLLNILEKLDNEVMCERYIERNEGQQHRMRKLDGLYG